MLRLRSVRVIKKTRERLIKSCCLFLVFSLPHAAAIEYPDFIPEGPYLSHVDLSYIDKESGGGYCFLHAANEISEYFGHQVMKRICIPEACKGRDKLINFNEERRELECIPSNKGEIKNFARHLYSELIPWGRFLKSCHGVVKTVEPDGEFLYATCESEDLYYSQKANITGCLPGQIENINGMIVCVDSEPKFRQILVGSYLNVCELANTEYNSATKIVSTICPYKQTRQNGSLVNVWVASREILNVEYRCSNRNKDLVHDEHDGNTCFTCKPLNLSGSGVARPALIFRLAVTCTVVLILFFFLAWDMERGFLLPSV